MSDKSRRRLDAPPVDQTYLADAHPPKRRETSDERRDRQREEVAGQQADLKRQAAERRAR